MTKEDFTNLKAEFSRKSEYTRSRIKATESEEGFVEIPKSIPEELERAYSDYYTDADKKFSNGNAEEAYEIMKEAINLVDKVLYDLLECRLLGIYKKASEVREFLDGYEYIVCEKFPEKYKKHFANFRNAKAFVDGYKSHEEKPQTGEFDYHSALLLNFLIDFRNNEEELCSAIGREEEEKKERKRMFRISIIATVVVAILGGGIKWLSNHFFGK